MPSFYITDPNLDVQGEYPSLKDAEKNVRTMPAGNYLILQVVREVTIELVPERTRVAMTLTRTRSRKPKPTTTRKPTAADPIS